MIKNKPPFLDHVKNCIKKLVFLNINLLKIRTIFFFLILSIVTFQEINIIE